MTNKKSFPRSTSSVVPNDLKCGKNGHVQNECKANVNEIICHKCGVHGHKSRTFRNVPKVA